MTTLSTHILDTTTGLPASDVHVSLYAKQDDGWQLISEGMSNVSGRIKAFEMPTGQQDLDAGHYQLVFATADYFAKESRDCFYPKVSIEFVLEGTQVHCHVPLLISSYGFSTYRGS